MFLNSVILFLQEILEAALLISVLIVLTQSLRKLWPASFTLQRHWIAFAIGLGMLGSWAYAMVQPVISTWFDYVGQEVVNASMQVLIILFLLSFCFLVSPKRIALYTLAMNRLSVICLTGLVALSIMREGSEIIVYSSGIFKQPENITPVMLGGMMAAGIGISSGVFLYFGLSSMNVRSAMRGALILLAFFAGNMAAQAVLLLTQADWLPYTAEVWNSSSLLSESSIAGRILYSLIGYEASPSVIQLLLYLLAMLSIILSPLFRLAWYMPVRENS